jgi:hypothetical protein
MSHLCYGYKMNERGRVVHRLFEHDDLMHGFARQEGWVDSPDKVPGAQKAMQAEAEAKAATAHTLGAEPRLNGPVHGEKRRPGRPRRT